MSYQRAREDSLELRSLASSDEGEESASVSDRGFSPLSSPISSPEGWAQDDALNLESIADPFSGLADPISGREHSLKKTKKLKYIHGLALVVGLQIGSGIFASPNQISSHAGSPGLALIVWVVAGLLAWTGASCYAELGAAIPLNGGTQAYLGDIFGPLPAFMYTWSAVTILKPGSAAIIALVCGEYLTKGIGSNSRIVNKIIAILGLFFTGALNCYSARAGAQAGKWFFGLKLVLLLFVVVMGMAGIPNFASKSSFADGAFNGQFSLSNMALALYGGLWAYDGWDNLNFVSGEMENAQRDLPRVISTAMPLVIVLYLLANCAYFVVLSKPEIDEAASVALTMAYKVLGAPGRVITAVAIGLSCLGALNATVFSSGHLIHAAAELKLLPKVLSRRNVQRHTPINAIILQTVLSCVYVVVGEFRSLVAFYGAAGYVFYLWAVVGLLYLRYKRPDLLRPFKVWAATPVFFSIVAIYLISQTVFSKPVMALGMFAFMLLAIPIYYAKLYFRL